MMYKLAVLAAVAISQIMAVAACSKLDDVCCNLDPHNHNIGDCYADRSICWEGTCMMCGINGKPKCPSGKPCDDGNEVNQQGWCSTIPGVPPPTPPAPENCGWLNEACCDDDKCLADRSACWENTCMDCGKNGKPKCPSGKPCDDGNEVNEQEYCTTIDSPPQNEHCGWLNEACCDDDECLQDRTVCWERKCMNCGKADEPQCPKNPECEDGTKKENGWCRHDDRK